MIDKINLLLGWFCAAVAGVALVVMMVLAFVDSIGRQLGRPLQGADEYVTFALLIFFFSAISLVVRDDRHIRVGLFSELYKPRLARMEYYFTGILEVVALCVFTWMIYDQANRLDRFGTLSGHFRIPMAPWVYAAALMSLIATWFALQNLWRLHKGPVPRPHAIPDEDQ